jgi:hypothetical protein
MQAVSNDARFERQWLAQWRAAGPALARLRERELAGLSPSDALEASETVLAIGADTPLPDHRRTWSGLIELQRLLRRTR